MQRRIERGWCRNCWIGFERTVESGSCITLAGLPCRACGRTLLHATVHQQLDWRNYEAGRPDQKPPAEPPPQAKPIPTSSRPYFEIPVLPRKPFQAPREISNHTSSSPQPEILGAHPSRNGNPPVVWLG